ncbi:aminotransferase class IV [Haliovirga abyssi]|uniref:Aminodeoxychorismate lyase n=1 Tax=Haliovirga abyssi TaxID=2996794 RepID=A0AAU9DAB2_9FUSO|nr:aminotransferase class IV [Haliovirga abyssi]BDU50275.1 aminodeoxychorismate lyase [Haliovirga abyssi]
MIYLNGKIEEESKILKAIEYGYGLFETIGGKGEKLYFFEEHFNRLKNGINRIGLNLKYDIEYLYNIVEDLIMLENIEKDEEFKVKVIVAEDLFYVSLNKIKLREEKNGIKVGLIKSYFQNELGFLKSLNYMNNILARKELKKNSYYEGVFINRNRHITEGTISNIFFIKEDKIFTPSLDLNILNGIIRSKIIEISKLNNIKIEEGHYYYDELLEADSIFFTNSLMKNGLLWVKEIDNKLKQKHEFITKIENEYKKILQK